MKLAPDKDADYRPDLGFEVWARCDAAFDDRAKDALGACFAAQALEPNGLVCGGAVFGRGEQANEFRALVVKMHGGTSCTNLDRRRVERWLVSNRALFDARVGPLCPTQSEDMAQGDHAPLPRPVGKDERERALWFRNEAIAVYRRAATVLGRPEIREAERDLLRSIELVQAGIDELCRALFRKLRLPLSGSRFDVTSFFDYDLERVLHPRRRRFGGSSPLREAFHDVAVGLVAGEDTITIPDLHDLEQHLVGASRNAIDELWKLLAAPRRSPVAKHLEQAADSRRERVRDARARERAEERPKLPARQTVTFAAASEVRVRAELAVEEDDRTTIPARLAKACGATVLPVEVPVYLRRLDKNGDTDSDRSGWIAAHPALIWISVPRTPWKAPVLAAVVPTVRCPVPRIGKDWHEDAVVRRHEHEEGDT